MRGNRALIARSSASRPPGRHPGWGLFFLLWRERATGSSFPTASMSFALESDSLNHYALPCGPIGSFGPARPEKDARHFTPRCARGVSPSSFAVASDRGARPCAHRNTSAGRRVASRVDETCSSIGARVAPDTRARPGRWPLSRLLVPRSHAACNALGNPRIAPEADLIHASPGCSTARASAEKL